MIYLVSRYSFLWNTRSHLAEQHCSAELTLGNDVKWSEVKICSEMRALSLIYIYVAVCRSCTVRYLIIICFSLLFSNYSTYIFLIFFLCFSFCIFVFYFVYSVILYFLCTVSPFLYSCLFHIFVPFYRPLPPGSNPSAVNKHHIKSRDSYSQ